MWNKTTYPFLVQALCIIPLKSIRMWASFCIFVDKSSIEIFANDGKDVFTLLTYPGEAQTGIELFAQKIEAYDNAVLDLCGLENGQIMEFDDFTDIVQKKILASGKRKEICGNCQWNSICESQKSRWEKC